MQKPTSGYGTYPPSKQLFGAAASKRVNGEIPYNYLSYNPRHTITDEDRWRCLRVAGVIFLALAVIALAITIGVLVDQRAPTKVATVVEQEWLQTVILKKQISRW